jgi:alkanesulfonate monooxygenase SsuD/methylene tetrahydromethanopterin reductase-like flavin-dependent oxidoreductase (luciferase family)
MRHAIYLPLFGPLADPATAVEIGRAAEEFGWDGLFVWDHVLSPLPESWEISDPWVVLAAIAASTNRIRLGTMVTPLARRRIIKLARETVALDRLSGGRLTLGLGLGGDGGREFSAFGDPSEASERAEILDQGVAALTALWSGESVNSTGRVKVDRVRIEPGPVQQPRIPIWFGCKGGSTRPVERAAAYDGIYPIEVDPVQVTRIMERVRELRGSLDGFDVALTAHPGVSLADLKTAGATWAMHAFWPGHRSDQVMRFVSRGVPPD